MGEFLGNRIRLKNNNNNKRGQEPLLKRDKFFVHTLRQATSTQEHLDSFVACFGVHLLIINFKFNFNSPLILYSFHFF